jgi:hypothetical protein
MDIATMAWLGVALVVGVGLCWLGGATKVNVTSTVWVLVVRQVATVGLTLVLAYAGWQLWKGPRAEPPAAPPAAEPSAPVAATPAHPSAPEAPAPASSSPFLRWLLWLNLCLALPWITAFATRYVLALRSNAASFSLLAAYVMADLAFGMLIAGFAFAGFGGVLRLLGVVALCLGYNYWACELVAHLWVGGRKRAP